MNDNRIIRFGVSLDKEILDKFDNLICEQGYKSRSKAIKDLIHKAITKENWLTDKIMIGTLSIIYSDINPEVCKRLNELKHLLPEINVSSTQIDNDRRFEVIIVKGEGHKIHQIAKKIFSTKGIEYGRLALNSADIPQKKS